MSRANPQAAIASEEQLVPSSNVIKITKNNQCVASDSNITYSFLKIVVKILKHHKLYKLISLTATVLMPPPISNKPYTKPPIEKVLLASIKTLGYDEDPKEELTTIPHFVVIRLHQPWRAILSVPTDVLLVKIQAGIEPDFEVNVSSKPKKVVVPRKTRTILVADNLIEQESVAIELAKSVSIEEQRLQQREIITQLRIEKLVEKDVDEGYCRKLEGGGGVE
ncbi:hypothetical protein Tco_1318150 [Tanacetum coccineum]